MKCHILKALIKLKCPHYIWVEIYPPCFLTGRLLFKCLHDRTPKLRRRYIIQPYSILNGHLVGSRAAWHHSRASKGLLSRVTDEKDSSARYCLQKSTVYTNRYHVAYGTLSTQDQPTSSHIAKNVNKKHELLCSCMRQVFPTTKQTVLLLIFKKNQM